jgi:hypothetical protein
MPLSCWKTSPYPGFALPLRCLVATLVANSVSSKINDVLAPTRAPYLSKDELLGALEGHVLDEGELVGTYER